VLQNVQSLGTLNTSIAASTSALTGADAQANPPAPAATTP
jgi:hypothetical protein